MKAGEKSHFWLLVLQQRSGNEDNSQHNVFYLRNTDVIMKSLAVAFFTCSSAVTTALHDALLQLFSVSPQEVSSSIVCTFCCSLKVLPEVAHTESCRTAIDSGPAA